MFIEANVVCDNPGFVENQNIGFTKNGNEKNDILLRVTIDLSDVELFRETCIEFNKVYVKAVSIITATGSYTIVGEYDEFAKVYFGLFPEKSIVSFIDSPQIWKSSELSIA